MRRTLTFFYDGALFLAALSLIGIFVLMVGESITRYLGGYITGASELVGWLCASAGLLALPATFKRGDMVRVGFLVDELPPTLRRLALATCLAVAFIFVSYMVYAVASYIWSGWRSEEMTQGMIEIPVWIPQSSFLVGSLLLWVAIVDELFVTFTLPANQLRAEKAMSADDVSVH